MGDIWHCAGGGFAGLAVCKMERRTEKRNNVLMEQYPSFVNRLWLLLGSGMTVQTGIRQILSEMEKIGC